MSDLSQINKKIQALIRDNPAMNKWPKHKKKYLKIISEHGDTYCSQNCKPEDKQFLLFFEDLKKIRLEIKVLKEQKEFLINGGKEKKLKPPVFNAHSKKISGIKIERLVLKPQTSKKKFSKKRRPSKKPSQRGSSGVKVKKAFTSGFFGSELQSGIWAKKR